ncbi:MAG: elongation factor P [Rickettsiales bacterium]
MKIIANSIRAGNVLMHNNRLYVVAKTPDHTKPGKGGAFVQVEMKDLKTGNKLNERFSSTENVEKVRLDQKEYQYLYIEDNKVSLMDLESYEQIEIPVELLGDKKSFLQDGMQVAVESYEGSAISVELPETVVATVVETEPVVKGQTASASYKPAILDNGIRVMVPPFVNTNDKLVVRTEDSSYVERAKP